MPSMPGNQNGCRASWTLATVKHKLHKESGDKKQEAGIFVKAYFELPYESLWQEHEMLLLTRNVCVYRK